MEKADKAIALAVDNAARIESTARLLRAHIDDAERTTARAEENAVRIEAAENALSAHIDSAVKVMQGLPGDDRTTFGNVGANGGVVVRFAGAGTLLYLNGRIIANGVSPFVASTHEGGLLELLGVRYDAYAIVIGGK